MLDFAAAGNRVQHSTGALRLKAAVFDGARVYLTDRNFTSRGANAIVIADPYAGDRQLVERAMLGVSGSNICGYGNRRVEIFDQSRSR